jgi:fermentation-respiration switch protein FrsA (DUF1100 family)
LETRIGSVQTAKNTMTETQAISRFSFSPAQRKRIFVLLCAALLLQWLFMVLPFLPLHGRSEKLHALLPYLWLVDFLLYKRRILPPRWGFALITSIGIATMLGVTFWYALLAQAQFTDGTAHWHEVLYKMYMMASLFVLYGLLSKAVWWVLCLSRAIRDVEPTARGAWIHSVHSVLAIGLFVPYLLAFGSIHRFKIGDGLTPWSAFELAYEDVAFNSDEDEIPLSGWFIPAARSDKAVIVCHGIGANKANFSGVSPFLHKAGLNVFLFDFRGHGDSDGHTITYGYEEARDVAGAVRYLQARGIKHIGLYGFSMGGSAVLHSLQRVPQVESIVVDSTFSDFPLRVEQQITWLPEPLDKVLVKAIDLSSQFELGISFGSISPGQHIAKFAPRPVLIIHGTKDSIISPQQAELNYAAAGQPKQLWLVPGADHIQCRAVAKQQYETRVAEFFTRTLGASSKVQPN